MLAHLGTPGVTAQAPAETRGAPALDDDAPLGRSLVPPAADRYGLAPSQSPPGA